MEVHHPTYKKKWSEYIIEFIMLFAAVTLGFFAENLREYKSMIERRDQNLISILQDLKQDSIFLESTIKYSDDGIRYFQKLKAKLYEFHDILKKSDMFPLNIEDDKLLDEIIEKNNVSFNIDKLNSAAYDIDDPLTLTTKINNLWSYKYCYKKPVKEIFYF